MPADANIAYTAMLLADPTRAYFLTILSDGRALPAGELARSARVSPSVASIHLTKLVEANLLTVEQQGRHRYFRLANPTVVQLLETLATISPPRPIRSLREAETGKAIRFARTCYDHLAGSLGVRITAALVQQKYLVEENRHFLVTERGTEHFLKLEIDVHALRGQRRTFAPCCLDWSERKYHIAGALGATLATRCFELGWIKRIAPNRALQVTAEGYDGLREVFNLSRADFEKGE